MNVGETSPKASAPTTRLVLLEVASDQLIILTARVSTRGLVPVLKLEQNDAK